MYQSWGTWGLVRIILGQTLLKTADLGNDINQSKNVSVEIAGRAVVCLRDVKAERVHLVHTLGPSAESTLSTIGVTLEL